jgi:sugar phosphate isomerase/epimerase
MERRAFLRVAVFLFAFSFSSLSAIGKPPKIRWSFNTISWGKNFEKSLRETAGRGINSFEAGPEIFEIYRTKPGDLKSICSQFGLKNWSLHAGIVPFDGSDKPLILDNFRKMAEFAQLAGATYIIVSTEKRDSYPPGNVKLAKLALTLDAFGAIAKKQGIRILLGNAMHSICQTADELEFTVSQCKSKQVGMMLDLAFMVQSGTKPEDCIGKWGKKIQAIRFNDITKPVKGFAGSQDRNYRIEIPGKGNSLNYPEILAALKKKRFKGLGFLGKAAQSDSGKNPLSEILESKDWLSTTGFIF